MRTEQASKKWARVVVVGLVCCACEPLGQAYGCGYDLGYRTMDCVLDDVEVRRDSQNAWATACSAHEPLTEDQQSAGDEVCRGKSSLATVVACNDPGPERATLPDTCVSFGDDGTFGCPAGVSGECLCCEETPVACGDAGALCSRDADCCSADCDLATGLCNGSG